MSLDTFDMFLRVIGEVALVHLIEHAATRDGEEIVKGDVHDGGNTEACEKRHLVDARRGERDGPSSCMTVSMLEVSCSAEERTSTSESNDVDKNASDVCGVGPELKLNMKGT